MPREHGAYVQLGFPLFTGLLYSGGQPGAVAFGVAAIALFLAHEPLAVLAGVRGVRLQKELHEPARRRILFLSGAALAGIVAAIGLAPAIAWLGAVLPAGLALLMLPLLGTERMKSLPAEILAAALFSTAVLTLALCGADDTAAATQPLLLQAALAAAVWFAAIVPAVFAVHAVKAAVRKRPHELWVLRAAPLVAAGVLTVVIGAGILLPAVRDLLAAIPPVVAALMTARRPPHPRYLKHIGWIMVVADTLALVLLLLL